MDGKKAKRRISMAVYKQAVFPAKSLALSNEHSHIFMLGLVVLV